MCRSCSSSDEGGGCFIGREEDESQKQLHNVDTTIQQNHSNHNKIKIRMTQGRLYFVRHAGVVARQCANSRRPPSPPSARKNFSRDWRLSSSASSSSNTDAGAIVPASIKYAKTTAGTGDPEGLGGSPAFSTRGPVTWPALGLVAIAAASAVGYYKIERERRLENAMGKIVSWD